MLQGGTIGSLAVNMLLLSREGKNAAKSLQSCPTLWPHRRQPTRLPHPWDSPGKNTGVGCHFLLQCVKVKSLSCVRLLATPWTAAHQAPPSTGFSRQEYWSGVPLPSPLWVAKLFLLRTRTGGVISDSLWLKRKKIHLVLNTPKYLGC